MYVVISGAIILISIISITHFYKQEKVIRTKYDETLAIYEKTLEMLKRERDAALKADRDIEEYAWKIRVAENALADVKQEKQEAARIEKELNGYMWKIELTEIGGTNTSAADSDMIFFENNRMNSVTLNQEGFQGTGYTRTESGDGAIIWETLQTSKIGETAGWRGEWDGKTMKGILSRRLENSVKDFSWTSVGERAKRKSD